MSKLIITSNGTIHTIPAYKIEYGECFEYNGDIWLRCSVEEEEEGYVYALCFTYYSVEAISEETEVIPANPTFATAP